METKFIPGLELSELYYIQEVKPILDKYFPGLKYSAGMFGWGSEVLGYDTEISRDHHWGPKVFLFLAEDEYSILKEKISLTLSENLPYTFMGYSTNFSESEPNGVRHLVNITSGKVNHMIYIFTIKSFWQQRLDFDPFQDITTMDWLTFPQRRLLEMVSGRVFYDGLGELNKIREKFSYFPKDVWLYLMASQWTKISLEEAFVGRAGDAGDELGSQVIASKIVRELMTLCFLIEKKYYPYSKWFGTGFAKLSIAKQLGPVLQSVLLSKTWQEREQNLSQAYKIVASLHNDLKITKSLPVETTSYHDRPYMVIHADMFADVIRNEIENEWLKNLKTNIGSIDQLTDNTDLSENPKLSRKLKIIYE